MPAPTVYQALNCCHPEDEFGSLQVYKKFHCSTNNNETHCNGDCGSVVCGGFYHCEGLITNPICEPGDKYCGANCLPGGVVCVDDAPCGLATCEEVHCWQCPEDPLNPGEPQPCAPIPCCQKAPNSYSFGPRTYAFHNLGTGSVNVNFSYSVEGCGPLEPGEPCAHMLPDDGFSSSLTVTLRKDNPLTGPLVTLVEDSTDNMSQVGGTNRTYLPVNTLLGHGSVALSLDFGDVSNPDNVGVWVPGCVYYLQISGGVGGIDNAGAPSLWALKSATNTGFVLVASVESSCCEAEVHEEDIDAA